MVCFQILKKNLSGFARMSHKEAAYTLTHVFAFADMPGHMISILDDGVLINHDDDANLATNWHVPGPSFPIDAPRSVVTAALLSPRYALVATRDIAAGAELTNDYAKDVFDPDYYIALCEEYGVEEDYL